MFGTVWPIFPIPLEDQDLYPMNRITVAAAALNQTPLAWDQNLRVIKQALQEARARGAQVVCLPELCITGYGCEDLFHSEEVAKQALACAETVAAQTKGLFVNFGLPLLVHGVVFNTVAVAVDGALRGFVAKQHLAGDGLHYEPRWFKPWPKGVVSSVVAGGRALSVGDIFFQVGDVRIGFEICEDAWVAERPGSMLAQYGIDLILNPSASHFAFGKHEVRKRFVLEGSRSCGVAYLYANLLGCEAGRSIYDGDTLIASHGELVAEGPRFSYKECVVTSATVDLSRSRLMRRRLSSFTPQLQAGERCVQIPGFSFRKPSLKTLSGSSSATPTWEKSAALKEEEFTRAVSLGLFDYLRKSRSHGFVISLSGGVDSSAASCLVRLMIQASVAELGLGEFKKRLSHITSLKSLRREKELARALLACVYQATQNSSAVTHTAAKTLANQIDATFYDLNIDPLVEEYKKLIGKELGVRLSWKEHDLALQNIQARVRSPSVWLIANLRKSLLLATSNRSEASVGYTTMDGDSSGGLAPLGGIDKAYLRKWLVWLEREGPVGLQAFSALSLVNVQAPTAELRPLRERQTDEGDLMPYEVLDSIERLAIRDKLLPLSVHELLCEQYRGRFSKQQLAHWVERFFTLWSVNQWKRERYAPSFHLDDENVDPKTWCRFPILSGGFTKELQALRKKQ
jgi:NAD+ synthase (glutamine-hydrolysing)